MKSEYEYENAYEADEEQQEQQPEPEDISEENIEPEPQTEDTDTLIAKIEYLAALKGISKEEYVDGLLSAHEAELRQRLEERYGDDTEAVEEMLEYKKQKNGEIYRSLLSERENERRNNENNVHARLAGEYAELLNEFPELAGKSFKELPTEVKRAGFSGERLINAYLYHKHNEDKKIKAAAAEKASAEAKSTGSMQSSGHDAYTDADRKYLNALWSK